VWLAGVSVGRLCRPFPRFRCTLATYVQMISHGLLLDIWISSVQLFTHTRRNGVPSWHRTKPSTTYYHVSPRSVGPPGDKVMLADWSSFSPWSKRTTRGRRQIPASLPSTRQAPTHHSGSDAGEFPKLSCRSNIAGGSILRVLERRLRNDPTVFASRASCSACLCAPLSIWYKRTAM
jgi:hypothetical protein